MQSRRHGRPTNARSIQRRARVELFKRRREARGAERIATKGSTAQIQHLDTLRKRRDVDVVDIGIAHKGEGRERSELLHLQEVWRWERELCTA